MKRIVLLTCVIVVVSFPAMGEESTGFVIWKAEELKSADGELATQVENHLAVERLGEFGSHFGLIVFRDADGEAEVHESHTDLWVVQKGQATLIVGGEVVDARETGPGEIRGPSIDGGKSYRLQPGDVVNIPPRTAHQVLVEEGTTFTYLILKVKE